MTVRLTVKCPKLAQFPAKGISPDEAKILSKSQIFAQTQINNSFNERARELGDILISKLTDCDMTWCKDGCIVISCTNNLAELEQVISDEGFEIQPDRSEIKHKVRSVSNAPDAISEEDIDEVFEPLNIGELKKLKSRAVTNKFKEATA